MFLDLVGTYFKCTLQC